MEPTTPDDLIPTFHQLLRNFQLSDQARQLLQTTTFVPMAAISSSGRNTIIRELVKTGKYHFVVSDTSRPPRDNDGVMEKDGVEYWFRDLPSILEDLKKGKYIEAAVIHTRHVYGTNVSEFQYAHDHNLIAITDQEVQGVDNVMKANGKTHPIFLLPPSYEEWRRRISQRGHMTPEELRNREKSAVFELSMALDHDYYHFIINQDLTQAVKDVDAVAHGGEVEGQAAARELARELRDRIQAELDA